MNPVAAEKEAEEPAVAEKEAEAPVVAEKEAEEPVVADKEAKEPVVTEKEAKEPGNHSRPAGQVVDFVLGSHTSPFSHPVIPTEQYPCRKALLSIPSWKITYGL